MLGAGLTPQSCRGLGGGLTPQSCRCPRPSDGDGLPASDQNTDFSCSDRTLGAAGPSSVRSEHGLGPRRDMGIFPKLEFREDSHIAPLSLNSLSGSAGLQASLNPGGSGQRISKNFLFRSDTTGRTTVGSEQDFLVRIRRESSPPLYPADPDKGFRKISCSDPTLQGVCPYVANRARELRRPKIEARRPVPRARAECSRQRA